MARIARLSAVLLAIILSVGSLAAQDITKGSIAGVVRDATGAVVPGVKVSLQSPYGEREVTTNATGEYIFPNLVVGSGYILMASKEGFTTAKTGDLNVRINHRTTADIVLQVGTTSVTVDVVSGATESIDLSTTTVGATIPESIYKNVPIGRNISSVIAMAPGVVDSVGAGVANPSINGASGLENQYIINGANVTDPGFGGFGTYSRTYGSLGNGVNFDFIQEVQVKSGGFEAQYGQALGGVVNVLTKSGGNDYHGSFYSYFQPHRFEAERPDGNQFTETKHTRLEGVGRYDFGGDLGGYVKKDKLFWYAGFNPQFARTYRSAPSAFANSKLGTVIIKDRTLNYQGKVNYNLTSSHQLEGSVFGDPSTTPVGFTRFTSLASGDDLRASGRDYGSRTWTGRYNGVITQKWVLSANYSNYFNEFKESPKYNGYQIQDNVPTQEKTGSRVIRNGLGFLETTESRVNQFTVASSHSFNVLGTHTVDYGYQFEDIKYDDIRLYTGPDFQLPDRPEFGVAAGKTQHGASLIRTHSVPTNLSSPIVLQVTRGNYSDPVTATDTRYHAAYIQDSWQIGRRITVRPGVRYEDQQMAGNASRYVFAPNWAPRIGVIVDPTGSRHSKLFANWGRFFEKIPLDIAVRSFSFESSVRGAWYKDQSGTIDLSPANYVPGGRIAPSGGVDALTLVAGGTKAQYQDEVVGGYEHEFSGGMAISSRFVYRHMRRILEDISGINVTQNLAGVPQQYVVSNPSAALDIFTNAFPCKPTDKGCDPETGFTAISNPLGSDGIPDGFPNPSRIYKAMEFQFMKRFSANWQIFANYRLAKLYGNFEGSFRNDNAQQDPNISSLFDFTNSDGLLAEQFQPGVLPADRRHVLKLFTNYQFSEGPLRNLNLGFSWNPQTGTPISKFLAHPAYDNSGEIPVGGRGALGRTDATFPVDLHADYTIKLGESKRLKLVADMFNIFNQKRVTRVDQNFELDSTTPNPDFLKPNMTDFQYPFQTPFFARLAVRFEF